jgi:hypothetical protein
MMLRTLTLISLLLVSAWLILSPGLLVQEGVFVAALDEGRKCSELRVGDVITQVRGQVVRNLMEFEKIVGKVKEGEFVPLVVNGRPGNCVALEDGWLGVEVRQTRAKGLKLGLEFGGMEIVYVANASLDELDEMSEVIGRRMSYLELPGSCFVSNSRIHLISLEEVELLTKRCRFDAWIQRRLRLENQTTILEMGGKEYELRLDGARIDNLAFGTDFELSGIEGKVVNFTNESVLVGLKVFGWEDILRVRPELSRIEHPAEQTYVINLPIELREEAIERFRLIAEPIESFFTGQEFVLQAQLVYELDGKTLSTLTIPRRLVEEGLRDILVIAFETSASRASSLLEEIEMCLVSGELAHELMRVEARRFEARQSLMGWAFLISVPGLLFLCLAVRKYGLKLGLIGFCLFGSELILCLGFAALTSHLFRRGWILDLPSFVGLFMLAVLSLLDYQRLRKSPKRLTFLLAVMGSCFPLLFTALKGMGLSILLGTLIGLSLTKPLYDVALETFS